jgi:3-phosphoshikimate 1-carboxyvinyltransferase
MKPFVVRPLSHLEGSVFLSGDKSIAHRSIIISALALGETKIKNFPNSKDCLSTIEAFKRLGIKIRRTSSIVNVSGKGLYGLHRPRGPIFVGDSGTTLRLLLGVLAGQSFKTKLVSGKSLSRRPMLRVTNPLRIMGAQLSARRITHNARGEEYPPISIEGGNLRPINYKMPVASAQVKSAILLAALYVKGKTCLTEQIPTRDHTERMLRLFKARLKTNRNTIVMTGNKELVSPKNIYIPADISSAGFFLVAAAVIPNSRVVIKNLTLNPSRTGIIKVLKRMGAKIYVSGIRHKVSGSEPMADIIAKSSNLKGVRVGKEEIPSLIDELPILAVAASLARGMTVFEGVGELRVKETDRIYSMTVNLKRMGANIAVSRAAGLENIIIRGVKQLNGAKVKSFGDHRTAMSMVVAGLAAKGTSLIDDISCINKSFPGFLSVLHSLKSIPSFA